MIKPAASVTSERIRTWPTFLVATFIETEANRQFFFDDQEPLSSSSEINLKGRKLWNEKTSGKSLWIKLTRVRACTHTGLGVEGLSQEPIRNALARLIMSLPIDSK